MHIRYLRLSTIRGWETQFTSQFYDAGYDVNLKMLNANDFGVPEDRDRIFFIGFRKDLHIKNFKYPEPLAERPVLRDAIWDLKDSAIPAKEKKPYKR